MPLTNRDNGGQNEARDESPNHAENPYSFAFCLAERLHFVAIFHLLAILSGIEACRQETFIVKSSFAAFASIPRPWTLKPSIFFPISDTKATRKRRTVCKGSRVTEHQRRLHCPHWVYTFRSSSVSMNQLDPEIYTIAWLAPLEIEARAALHMLDHQHQGRFPMSRGDDYVFQAGDVCGHNVIIATLPAGQEYGNSSAAALASQVKKFFPNLWFGLLVGVAAGLPNLSRQPPYDIRLGDVLVGLPDGESAGLIAYGLGEAGEDGFKPLRLGHALATTETVVRSAIGSIKLRDMNGAMSLKPYYNQIRDKQHPCGTFTDPGQENDALYEINNGGKERSIRRKQRPSSTRTQVWYGPIGSGEKLIKNTENRNELRDKYNIIGLEMEAAGTINRINVGVIRGVCNYGDRHENKQWQPYAAAMAAAFAKAILAEISPKNAARVPELHLGNRKFTTLHYFICACDQAQLIRRIKPLR